MRLLTHNILQCNKKNCVGGFPLEISLVSPSELEALQTESDEKNEKAGLEREKLESLETVPSEFRMEFMKAMRTKIEWPALVAGAKSVGLQIPANVKTEDWENEAFLRDLHKVINEVHVQEGRLTCPKCGCVYPILHGIPNMVHTTDE